MPEARTRERGANDYGLRCTATTTPLLFRDLGFSPLALPYAVLSSRVSPHVGRETETPCFLTKDRYPSWYGEADTREERMRDELCASRVRMMDRRVR